MDLENESPTAPQDHLKIAEEMRYLADHVEKERLPDWEQKRTFFLKLAAEHLAKAGLGPPGGTSMDEALTTDENPITKVEGKLPDLLTLYEQIHPTLAAATIDPEKLTDYQRSKLDQLNAALDPPDSIDAAKAVAVLKAIRDTGPQDKFHLEAFHGLPMTTGLSVGPYIVEQLKALGLTHNDLLPFLKARGWLKAT